MVKKPVRSIVGAVAAAAARWTTARFSSRRHALGVVQARTGYSLPSVEFAFDELFGRLQREAIEAVIASELGSLDVLDHFVERPGLGAVRALPIGRVCVISSRTTIGVAIVPAIFALCAKCDVLVKDREDHLVAAFFETLASELPELRHVATARTWRGDRDAGDLADFDAVVAFGSDATMTAIAKQLSPRTRFIPFGSKASAGYVTRDALRDSAAARSIAERAATDLLLYQTEGCLSLHVLFVEHGGGVSPAQFAEMLGDAIRTALIELDLGCSDDRRRGQVAAARDLATFRARAGDCIHSDPQATYLVVMDPPCEEPPLFLPRSLGVRSVESPLQALAYLRGHRITLEALAVAGRRSDIIEFAARAGAARVTRFGMLQAPPLGAFHGGRPRIAEFVRWISDET